jgi:vancomycin permeability regulator SanA
MRSQHEATSIASEGASSAPSVFVIFGAAVWKDGRASNAMRRRVEGALRSARDARNAIFLVSGGVGEHPPSEAAVMSRLLQEAGVPEKNILLEEESTDTLQSVGNCVRILQSLTSSGDVVVCSDVYHIPRCRWLFKLYGISTRPGEVASGRSQNKLPRWWYYYLREFAALPWDTLMVLGSRAGIGERSV